MPLFSVIIVNYNGGAFLQGAVDSLASQTCQDFELFILDNASEDGSIDRLDTSAIAHCEIICSADNLGFAEGNNRPARKASGEWLVLLNPDAEAAPDWLEAIERATRQHPGTVMFASAQYSLSDASVLDGAGDCYLVYGVPWRGGFGHPASALPASPGTCFSPCGAGAVFRRDIFLAEGGFLADLFCFCEDVDLGFRLRLLGYDCVFLPDAVIHHEGGGVSGKASDKSVRLGARNRITVYVRNMPLVALVATLPVHIMLTIGILGRGLFTGRFAATWQGVRQGLQRLPTTLAERSAIQVRRKVKVWSLIRSMAWNPLHLLWMSTHVRPLQAPRPAARPSHAR